MEVLKFALNSVLPIVLLILLGYFLKRIKLTNNNFNVIGNKLVFRLFLPCSLFLSIYNIEKISDINLELVFYSVIMIFVLFFIGLIFVLIFVKDNNQKGVILQNAFRSNYSIIGLPLIQFMTNNDSNALAQASVVMLVSIPLFNILAVISLSIFVKNGNASFKKIILNIIKNPLIIGILSGFLLVLIRPYINFSIKTDTKFLFETITSLSKVASPLALIVLGGNFEFNEVKEMFKEITYGVLLKIVISPILGLGLSILLVNNNILHFTKVEYPALIALFAAPSAVASAVMAKEMKNDDRLAGQIVMWTNVFSMLTMFIIIVILKGINLL